MISPLAPLQPWLLSPTLGEVSGFVQGQRQGTIVAIRKNRRNEMEYAFRGAKREWSSEPLCLDLRHFATRAVVLQVLSTYGYSYPWVLGEIWSDLTNEQAGRVAAEIVRRAGADPKNPSEVLPFGVLSEWLEPEEGDKPPKHITRGRALAWREVVIGNDDGGRYACVFEYSWLADFRPPEGVKVEGRETGLAGRVATDRAARASGAIFWEEITP